MEESKRRNTLMIMIIKSKKAVEIMMLMIKEPQKKAKAKKIMKEMSAWKTK